MNDLQKVQKQRDVALIEEIRTLRAELQGLREVAALSLAVQQKLYDEYLLSRRGR